MNIQDLDKNVEIHIFGSGMKVVNFRSSYGIKIISDINFAHVKNTMNDYLMFQRIHHKYSNRRNYGMMMNSLNRTVFSIEKVIS